MQIIAKIDIQVPGLPQITAGETCFVPDEVGTALVERGQAEFIVPPAPPQPAEAPTEPKKSAKKNQE